MKTKLLMFASAFASLAGCGMKSENLKPILADIQTCKRHYTGSIAIGTAGISDNATFTLQIDCEPMQGVTSGVTTTPVPATVPLK
jgi:hypothetical protein